MHPPSIFRPLTARAHPQTRGRRCCHRRPAIRQSGNRAIAQSRNQALQAIKKSGRISPSLGGGATVELR
eukprot:1656635-Prymnesium_polylepis.1